MGFTSRIDRVMDWCCELISLIVMYLNKDFTRITWNEVFYVQYVNRLLFLIRVQKVMSSHVVLFFFNDLISLPVT